MNEETKTDKSRRARGVKALRDQTVVAKAMTGMKTAEIAAEVGLSRQTVSEILNSEVVEEKIGHIRARLANGIDDAIQTVLESVSVDYNAARDLLRYFGAMTAPKTEAAGFGPTLEELIGGSFVEEDRSQDGGVG